MWKFNYFLNKLITCKKNLKWKKIILKISSHSNWLSNSCNSSSNCSFISINSIKSLRDLQPTLVSLGQFLLTKINFSKYFDCKRHLLRLVSMLTKRKSLMSLFVIQQFLIFVEQENQ
jgi:hypothetical protein